MKTLFLTTLLVCWGAFSFSAPISIEENCSFVTSETLTLAQQLLYTLPEGMWRGTTRDGKEAAIQFTDSGEAYWFTFGRRGITDFQDYQWFVYAPTAETAVLELQKENGQATYAFEVKAECQSISLYNLQTGAQLVLGHDPASSEASLLEMKEMLDGKWENNTYPFDIKGIDGAYLKYRFYGTGKMERLCGTPEQTIRAVGEWHLSNDGQLLIMTFDDDATVIAEIKHLDMDELVLTHVLACEDERFATGRKDFFFNVQ